MACCMRTDGEVWIPIISVGVEGDTGKTRGGYVDPCHRLRRTFTLKNNNSLFWKISPSG